MSDLSEGDELQPVTYVMSPFVVREYCHGVGENDEAFHSGIGSPTSRQMVPPTLVHVDKIRLLKKNCPGGPGPNARIHYEYSGKQHGTIPVGKSLTASGKVARRYTKRGRTFLELQIELRTADNAQLLVSYRDTAILAYEAAE